MFNVYLDWEKPIPQILLLLGKNQHIPLRLITARMTFGVLEGEKTGVNFSECPIPEKIVIIGTVKECEIGYRLVVSHFQDVSGKISCFSLVDSAPLYKDITDTKLFRNPHEDIEHNTNYGQSIIITRCFANKLEDVMDEKGLPMYREFKFDSKKWVAI